MSSAGVGSGMIGWADRRLEGWSSTGIAVLAALAGMLAAAIVVVGYAVFLRFLGSGEANYVLQFAGTSDRLASRAGEFTLGEARGAQMWGFAFAVVWGVVGYVLFAVFWKHCWNAGPAANAGVVSGIRYLPVAVVPSRSSSGRSRWQHCAVASTMRARRRSRCCGAHRRSS